MLGGRHRGERSTTNERQLEQELELELGSKLHALLVKIRHLSLLLFDAVRRRLSTAGEGVLIWGCTDYRQRGYLSINRVSITSHCTALVNQCRVPAGLEMAHPEESRTNGKRGCQPSFK